MGGGVRRGARQGWRDLRPVFIDFEASGTTGWPIEVGWAEVVGGEVVSESRLIRPEPDWDEGEWDPLAEEVHGLPLDRLLREGEAARAVAARLLAVLRGRTAVSDTAPFDAAFLRRLLEAHGGEVEEPRIVDAAALRGLMDEGAAARFDAALAAAPTGHRAGGDAARLALAWRAALRSIMQAPETCR